MWYNMTYTSKYYVLYFRKMVYIVDLPPPQQENYTAKLQYTHYLVVLERIWLFQKSSIWQHFGAPLCYII
jgi:hypothetical protein